MPRSSTETGSNFRLEQTLVADVPSKRGADQMVRMLKVAGSNAAGFLAFSNEVAQDSPPDRYELAYRRAAFLASQEPGVMMGKDRVEDLTGHLYALCIKQPEEIERHVTVLSREANARYTEIVPLRYWQTATVHATVHAGGEVRLCRVATEPYVQTGGLRQLPRVFQELPEDYTEDPRFLSVLETLVRLVHTTAGAVEYVLKPHLMTTRSTAQQVFTLWDDPRKTEDSCHQDGTYGVLSALVMERQHAEGAESRVYVEDPGIPRGLRPVLRHELQPGEGIFHRDQAEDPITGEPGTVWHGITPLQVRTGSMEARRTILSVDVDPVGDSLERSSLPLPARVEHADARNQVSRA